MGSNEVIQDYLTGACLPDTGAEANRQNIIRFLLEQKGYKKTDIILNFPLEFEIRGEKYSSKIDLVIKIEGRFFMAIKCAAGSIASCEREIIAAARIACEDQIPFAVASDGADALLFNAISGRHEGKGLNSIPSLSDALAMLASLPVQKLDSRKLEQMRLVFKTYDMENVNRI